MIYIYNYSNRNEINYFINNNIKPYSNNFTEKDQILIFIELYSKSLSNIGLNNNFVKNNTDYSNLNRYIIDDTIRYIINKTDKYYIILYSIGEVRNILHDFEVEKFKMLIKDVYNLSLDKIVISSCDILHKNIIYLKYNLKYISYDWVYLNEKLNVKQQLQIDYNKKDKYIISLNRNINIERFYFCYYMNKYYSTNIYMSYLNNSQKCNSITNESNKIHNIKCNYNKFIDFSNKLLMSKDDINSYNKFEQNMPYTLDSKQIWYKIDNELQTYMNNSYINIVFETNYDNNNRCLQVSEKTYKPIYSGKIFIIFGKKPGILKHLRNNNFKTFAPYINEEYDKNEPNLTDSELYIHRYKLLLKEIDRIMALSEDDIYNIYINTIDIVKHNYNLLYNQHHVPSHKIFDLLE